MNDNMNNMEEVPLDLFSQVSLDDYEKAEDVPEAKVEEEAPAPTGPGVISIPLNAYAAVRAKEEAAKKAAAQQAQPAPATPVAPAAPAASVASAAPAAPVAPAATMQQTVVQGPTNVVPGQTGVIQ